MKYVWLKTRLNKLLPHTEYTDVLIISVLLFKAFQAAGVLWQHRRLRKEDKFEFQQLYWNTLDKQTASQRALKQMMLCQNDIQLKEGIFLKALVGALCACGSICV